MMLTLELPKELEDELIHEAVQLGLSLPEYTLRLLFSRPVIQTTPKTGAELVSYWKSSGLIGTRPDILDSQQHARQIREKAEKRSREVKS